MDAIHCVRDIVRWQLATVATSCDPPAQDFRSQRTATLPRIAHFTEMRPHPEAYISTLLHGHFHDGEGAPLYRPLARLTSFGGYVAMVPAREDAPNRQMSK